MLCNVMYHFQINCILKRRKSCLKFIACQCNPPSLPLCDSAHQYAHREASPAALTASVFVKSNSSPSSSSSFSSGFDCSPDAMLGEL